MVGIASASVAIKHFNDENINTTREIFPTSFLGEKTDFRKLFHQLINQTPPQLCWKSFHKNGCMTAEVLLSAEFISLSVPTITIAKRDKNDEIPATISPHIRKFRIEVTFAGIRNIKFNASNFSSARYKIELAMGEVVLSSSFSSKSYNKNVNFLEPYASGYLLLPEQFQFWPPIIVKHLDCNHKPPNSIGAAMIRRAEKFFVDDKPKELHKFLLNTEHDEEIVTIGESEPLLGKSSNSDESDSLTNLKRALQRCKLPKFLQKTSSQSNRIKSVTLENEYTWWTKFYKSNRDAELRNESLHELKIYHCELEKQIEFECFNDWAHPIDLYRGKQSENYKGSGEKYATLKCSLRISKCSGKEYFQTEKFEGGATIFK